MVGNRASPSAPLTNVDLHLVRLQRHYDSAVRTYDEVSLLDLSHSLRIWVELKAVLVEHAPAFTSTMAFKTALPARKVLKAAKGHRYVFSCMPGGVVTYAANGDLARGPGVNGNFTAGISVKRMADHLVLKRVCFVSAVFDQPVAKALGVETVTRCNYQNWLGSEAVRLSYDDENGQLSRAIISREMMIKRVANTLDGSHASAAGYETDNTFDGPIHHLLKYSVGGLPLPYFVLLKIAQDMLDVLPKLLKRS